MQNTTEEKHIIAAIIKPILAATGIIVSCQLAQWATLEMRWRDLDNKITTIWTVMLQDRRREAREANVSAEGLRTMSRHRLCKFSGCMRVAIESGRYCAPHVRVQQVVPAAPQKRKRVQEKTAARGYNESWRRMRKHFLRQPENVCCKLCGGPAAVVDHVVPHRGDRQLFHDRANWQPLCVTCHGRKSQTEMIT
jgi:5-methylcytosine-specific restriction protein A